MGDRISRRQLIQELECFKMQLGDIVLGWVVDRILDIVHRLPGCADVHGGNQ